MPEELIISNFINQLKELEENTKDQNNLMKNTKHLVRLYNTLRVDIKNKENKDNDISIINCSDDDAEITRPKWLSNSKGKGAIVQSETGFMNLELLCINDGVLILTFRGPDYKNKKNEREPIYVECTGLKINGESVIESPIFITHDNFYRYRINVENGQKIKINMSWNTLSDTTVINPEYVVDESANKKFDELNKQFNQFKKETNEILDSNYKLLNTLFKYYELKPKGIMEKIQLLNLELVNFIDNVCKKYNLEYWIECGTLLGAFRHGDFIPWDDDIDLGMMRKDYEKLLKVLRQEVKANDLDKYITVERMDRMNNNNFLISFMKLSFRFNHTLFGFIDIFPFDYTNDKNINVKSYKKEQKLFLDKAYAGEDKRKAFDVAYKNLKLTQEVGDYIVPGVDSTRVGAYGFQRLESDVIFPLKSVKVKDTLYPCPNKSDEYLKLLYGDYSNIPKVIKTHGLIDLKRKVDNEEESYNEAINELRNINQSFND